VPEIDDPVDRDSADRAYATLPPLNGYAETFSVFVEEPVAIRVARKPPARDLRGTHKARPEVSVAQIKIRNAVTGKVVSTQKPKVRTRIFEQVPADFKDEGAGYTCRVSVDTAGLPPGVYECVIADSEGHTSREIYFNLKPRTFASYDIVCVLPTFTWQAYNRVGGGSFYNNTKGPELTVSLHRPISRKRDNHIDAAIPFLALFEQERIRYACVDSSDLHHRRLPSGKVPVMALLTHDEYWSLKMRREIDRYLAKRGVLLVMAGNVCWWRVDVDGNNVIVKKKNRQEGLWVHRGMPEETTFVSSFRFGGYPVDIAAKMPRLVPRIANLSRAQIEESRAMQIVAPDHPLFRGIASASFGGDVPIMYREVDGVPLREDGGLARKWYGHSEIAPRILATSIAVRGYRRTSVRKVGVIVEARIGVGHVLHMGTFGWSLGLSKKNKAVRQIVVNAYRYCRALAD
jgi:hypothetical protein